MHIEKLFDLQGKNAVVTGGAGIYGTPITEALAEAGAHVIVASRNLEKCLHFAEEMKKRGLSVSGETYDQSDEQNIVSFHERLMKKFGIIDILINNAVARPMKTFEDPARSWRESMDVNASGLFIISRLFMNSMISQKSGSIINISSIQGVCAPRFQNYSGTNMTTPPDYHFHKHGLIGLTKYLAALGGPHGVRVNAISPGGFFSKDLTSEFSKKYCARTLLERPAGHDDIKGIIVLLAGPASSYITGQNIIVDGGYTC